MKPNRTKKGTQQKKLRKAVESQLDFEDIEKEVMEGNNKSKEDRDSAELFPSPSISEEDTQIGEVKDDDNQQQLELDEDLLEEEEDQSNLVAPIKPSKRSRKRELKMLGNGEFMSLTGRAKFKVVDMSKKKMDPGQLQQNLLSWRDKTLGRRKMVSSRTQMLLSQKRVFAK